MSYLNRELWGGLFDNDDAGEEDNEGNSGGPIDLSIINPYVHLPELT
jgi:hypothetical protein